MKSELLKLDSPSPWKLIGLTSCQGHACDNLIWAIGCVCVSFVWRKGEEVEEEWEEEEVEMQGGREDDGSFTRALNV